MLTRPASAMIRNLHTIKRRGDTGTRRKEQTKREVRYYARIINLFFSPRRRVPVSPRLLLRFFFKAFLKIRRAHAKLKPVLKNFRMLQPDREPLCNLLFLSTLSRIN